MARLVWLVMVLTAVLTLQSVSAQTLSGEALVKALQQGGYVLVMRHTSSPRDAPPKAAAQLPSPHVQAELGDGGQSLGSVTEAQSAWLKQQVLERPRGTNTILVTHLPNKATAFQQETSGLSDGETLVFHADGAGGRTLTARIKIEQWSTMQP